MSVTGLPLDDLLASFDIELRAAGRTAGTRKVYSEAVDLFSRWCVENGHSPSLEALTRSNIAAWLADYGATVKTNTLRSRYRGLGRFCRFLVDEGELERHPMATLQIPEAETPHVPLFTDEELAGLIKACAGKGWQDRRDEAILRVFIDCGVRIGELCTMTVERTDLKRELAVVVGKGSKDRPVYFSPKTTRAIDRWMRARRLHKHAGSSALWLSARGPLTIDGARWIVTTRAEKAGLSGGDVVHPHRFRHTWASDFLLAGGQQTDLKRLAGWSSDVMLSRYGAAAADVRAMAAARRLQRGDRV